MEQPIKEMMRAIIASFDQKNTQQHSEAYKTLKNVQESHPELFLQLATHTIQNFTSLVESVIALPPSEDDLLVEHLISGLYKHFHTERIEKLEGDVCCYDKACFVEKMTLQALQTNQNLSLYAEDPDIKEGQDRQAYWSPSSVHDTDEAMNLFWKWYLPNLERK